MLHVHWLAVLVASVAGFAVGGMWYGPLFGKAWMAARGMSEADKAGAKSSMPLIFGLTFLLNLVSATVLDHVMTRFGVHGAVHTAMVGGGVALGFVIPSMGVNYLFSRMSRALFAIDAGYWLVIYLVMAFVLMALS